MNKCHFMGRLTRDPEIRYTNGEPPVPVVNYTLAVDRKYKRKDEPNADFFDFVGYDKFAEFAEKYYRKGIKVVVTARCQKRSYTNKEGRKITITEFIIEDQVNYSQVSRHIFRKNLSGSSASDLLPV